MERESAEELNIAMKNEEIIRNWNKELLF